MTDLLGVDFSGELELQLRAGEGGAYCRVILLQLLQLLFLAGCTLPSCRHMQKLNGTQYIGTVPYRAWAEY